MSDAGRSKLLIDALLSLARASSDVARYCDRAEHVEKANVSWIDGAAQTILDTACAIAAHDRVDLHELYARRLRQNEALSPLFSAASFDGGSAVRAAQTWRELQLAQIGHDREFRPDVFGLSRASQTRHYCLHVAKLVGRLADEIVAPSRGFHEKWLPDIFLMGIKLATVIGRDLPDTPMPWLKKRGPEQAASRPQTTGRARKT